MFAGGRVLPVGHLLVDVGEPLGGRGELVGVLERTRQRLAGPAGLLLGGLLAGGGRVAEFGEGVDAVLELLDQTERVDVQLRERRVRRLRTGHVAEDQDAFAEPGDRVVAGDRVDLDAAERPDRLDHSTCFALEPIVQRLCCFGPLGVGGVGDRHRESVTAGIGVAGERRVDLCRVPGALLAAELLGGDRVAQLLAVAMVRALKAFESRVFGVCVFALTGLAGPRMASALTSA